MSTPNETNETNENVTDTTQTTEAETTEAETAGTENVEAIADGAHAFAATSDRNYRKVRQGYVVSDKMDKTVTVLVEDRVKHALYGKVLRRSHKVKAHDEQGAAGIGDRVVIMETRPLSATKRWRLIEIVEKAK